MAEAGERQKARGGTRMFGRISHWCRKIWERNRRFKTAFLGSWGICLTSLVLTATGQGSQWMQWTVVSQGLLAVLLVLLFSVPWRLYNEKYGRIEPRREAANFLLFLLLWRGMEQLPSFNDYLFMGSCGTAALSAALALFFCDTPQGRKSLFPAFLLALGKSLLLGMLVQMLLGIVLSGIKMLLYPRLSLGWLWLSGILSLTVAWQVLLAQIPREDEALELPDWYPSLCRNLLLPAAVLLVVILYIFLGKSLGEGALPVGIMNPYGSCALAFYALFYFSYPDEEPPWVRKVLKWGALLLVPVAAAQLRGVWIRLEAYGLTSLRYLSLCCTFTGLCVLFWGITKRNPRKLYLLCGILSGILAFSPLNLVDLPAWVQAQRLEETITRNHLLQEGELVSAKDISPEDGERIRSSYLYLARSAGRWRYPLVEQIKGSSFLATLPVPEKEKRRPASRYCRYEHPLKSLPVSGYSRVVFLGRAVIQNHQLRFSGEGNTAYSLPIAPAYLQHLREKYPSGGKVEGKDLQYQPEERKLLIFTLLEGTREGYDQKEKGVISVQGYLLER